MTSSTNSGKPSNSPFGGAAVPPSFTASGGQGHTFTPGAFYTTSPQMAAQVGLSYFGGEPYVGSEYMSEDEAPNSAPFLGQQGIGLTYEQMRTFAAMERSHAGYTLRQRAGYISDDISSHNPVGAAARFYNKTEGSNTAIANEMAVVQHTIQNYDKYSETEDISPVSSLQGYYDELDRLTGGVAQTMIPGLSGTVSIRDYLLAGIIREGGKAQVDQFGSVNYMPSRAELSDFVDRGLQSMGLDPESSVPLVAGSIDAGDTHKHRMIERGMAQAGASIAQISAASRASGQSPDSFLSYLAQGGSFGDELTAYNDPGSTLFDGAGSSGGGGSGGGGSGGGPGGGDNSFTALLQAIVGAIREGFDRVATSGGQQGAIGGPATAGLLPAPGDLDIEQRPLGSVATDKGFRRTSRELAQREFRFLNDIMAEEFDPETGEVIAAGGFRQVGGGIIGAARGFMGKGQFSTDTMGSKIGNLLGTAARIGLSVARAGLSYGSQFGGTSSFIDAATNTNLSGLGSLIGPQLSALQGLPAAAAEVELRAIQAQNLQGQLFGYGGGAGKELFSTTGGMGGSIMGLSQTLGIAPGAAAELLRATYATGGGANLGANDIARLVTLGLDPAQIAGMTAQNLNAGLTGGMSMPDLVVSGMRQGFSGERSVQMAELAGNFARQRANAGLSRRNVSDVYQQMMAMSNRGGTSMMHAATVLGKGQEIGGNAAMSIVGGLSQVANQAMFAGAFTQTGSLTGAIDLLRNSTPEQQQGLLGGMGITGELQGLFLRTQGYTGIDISSFTGKRAELSGGGLASVDLPGEGLRVSRAATSVDRGKLQDIYGGGNTAVIERIEAVIQQSVNFQSSLVKDAGLTKEEIQNLGETLIEINRVIRDNLVGLLQKELQLLRAAVTTILGSSPSVPSPYGSNPGGALFQYNTGSGMR